MQPENLNPLRSYLNTTTSARCSFENPNWGLHRFLNSLYTNFKSTCGCLGVFIFDSPTFAFIKLKTLFCRFVHVRCAISK